MTLVLISPHADDIALCLGGWLAASAAGLQADGQELVLVTVFSRSEHAPCSPADGAEAEVSRLRDREDASYALRRGLHQQVLGLRDSSCMGLDGETELLAPDDSDSRRPVVEAAIRSVAASGTVLFAPLALGGHVDHRLVRRAVAQVAETTTCIWYEDLPYVLEDGSALERGMASPVTGVALSPWLFDISSHLDRKREDLLTYRSQLTPEEVQAVLDYCPGPSGTPPAERVWVDVSADTTTERLADLGFWPG